MERVGMIEGRHTDRHEVSTKPSKALSARILHIDDTTGTRLVLNINEELALKIRISCARKKAVFTASVAKCRRTALEIVNEMLYRQGWRMHVEWMQSSNVLPFIEILIGTEPPPANTKIFLDMDDIVPTTVDGRVKLEQMRASGMLFTVEQIVLNKTDMSVCIQSAVTNLQQRYMNVESANHEVRARLNQLSPALKRRFSQIEVDIGIMKAQADSAGALIRSAHADLYERSAECAKYAQSVAAVISMASSSSLPASIHSTVQQPVPAAITNAGSSFTKEPAEGHSSAAPYLDQRAANAGRPAVNSHAASNINANPVPAILAHARQGPQSQLHQQLSIDHQSHAASHHQQQQYHSTLSGHAPDMRYHAQHSLGASQLIAAAAPLPSTMSQQITPGTLNVPRESMAVPTSSGAVPVTIPASSSSMSLTNSSATATQGRVSAAVAAVPVQVPAAVATRIHARTVPIPSAAAVASAASTASKDLPPPPPVSTASSSSSSSSSFVPVDCEEASSVVCVVPVMSQKRSTLSTAQSLTASALSSASASSSGGGGGMSRNALCTAASGQVHQHELVLTPHRASRPFMTGNRPPIAWAPPTATPVVVAPSPAATAATTITALATHGEASPLSVTAQSRSPGTAAAAAAALPSRTAAASTPGRSANSESIAPALTSSIGEGTNTTASRHGDTDRRAATNALTSTHQRLQQEYNARTVAAIPAAARKDKTAKKRKKSPSSSKPASPNSIGRASPAMPAAEFLDEEPVTVEINVPGDAFVAEPAAAPLPVSSRPASTAKRRFDLKPSQRVWVLGSDDWFVRGRIKKTKKNDVGAEEITVVLNTVMSAPDSMAGVSKGGGGMVSELTGDNLEIAVILDKSDTSDHLLALGLPVVAPYDPLAHMYSGVVAEPPCSYNRNRFLIFFDDGLARYVHQSNVHPLVQKQFPDDDSDTASKVFLESYFRDIVRGLNLLIEFQPGQEFKTEWNGDWLMSRVTRIDSSLVEVKYVVTSLAEAQPNFPRTEWLHRGSPRLQPVQDAKDVLKKKPWRKLDPVKFAVMSDTVRYYATFCTANGPRSLGDVSLDRGSASGNAQVSGANSAPQQQSKRRPRVPTAVAVAVGGSDSSASPSPQSQPQLKKQGWRSLELKDYPAWKEKRVLRRQMREERRRKQGKKGKKNASSTADDPCQEATTAGTRTESPPNGDDVERRANDSRIASTHAAISSSSLHDEPMIPEVDEDDNRTSAAYRGKSPLLEHGHPDPEHSDLNANVAFLITEDPEALGVNLLPDSDSCPDVPLPRCPGVPLPRCPDVPLPRASDIPSVTVRPATPCSADGQREQGQQSPVSDSDCTIASRDVMADKRAGSTDQHRRSAFTAVAKLRSSSRGSASSMGDSDQYWVSDPEDLSMDEEELNAVSASNARSAVPAPIFSPLLTSSGPSSRPATPPVSDSTRLPQPATISTMVTSFTSSTTSASVSASSSTSSMQSSHGASDTASLLLEKFKRKFPAYASPSAPDPHSTQPKSLTAQQEQQQDSLASASAGARASACDLAPGYSPVARAVVRGDSVTCKDYSGVLLPVTAITVDEQRLAKDCGSPAFPAATPSPCQELNVRRDIATSGSPSHNELNSKHEWQPEVDMERPQYVSHKCSGRCANWEVVPSEILYSAGLFSRPLLAGWKREKRLIRGDGRQLLEHCTYQAPAPCLRRLRNIEELEQYLHRTGTSNVAIDQFSFDPQIRLAGIDASHQNLVLLSSDITGGSEKLPILGMGHNHTVTLPQFQYSPKDVYGTVRPTADPDFLVCCDCTDGCLDKDKCACQRLSKEASRINSVQENNAYAYSQRRKLAHTISAIYECNSRCSCSSTCSNRVVQHGLQLRLVVYNDGTAKGWGIFSLDDIPKGTFVCTYVGMLLTEEEGNATGAVCGDEYFADLDHIEQCGRQKAGFEQSAVDFSYSSSTLELSSLTPATSGSGVQSESESPFRLDAAPTRALATHPSPDTATAGADSALAGRRTVPCKRPAGPSDSSTSSNLQLVPVSTQSQYRTASFLKPSSAGNANAGGGLLSRDARTPSSSSSSSGSTFRRRQPIKRAWIKPTSTSSETNDASLTSTRRTVFGDEEDDAPAAKKTMVTPARMISPPLSSDNGVTPPLLSSSGGGGGGSKCRRTTVRASTGGSQFSQGGRSTLEPIVIGDSDDSSAGSPPPLAWRNASAAELPLPLHITVDRADDAHATSSAEHNTSADNIATSLSSDGPKASQEQQQHSPSVISDEEDAPLLRKYFGDRHPVILDAKKIGNVGRFINHSCDANLFVQNIFMETHDLRFPTVAFFAMRNIAAGTELTWTYGYEVGSVKGKYMQCLCGAPNCKGRLL
eukprot:scpid27079/ scgid6852/ Histone-lysine N-methyltransferase SETDB1; ERG-associated protein with SET domain; Histone H3-K9 methyltransferase 4; Lysine N-methyltransferase 1E; SET domain bifurcated 1